MIGFLFDVDQIIFKDNTSTNILPSPSGTGLYNWNIKPGVKATFQPKFNLPERVEQAEYPEGANKYADKYGYSKLAFANYKEDYQEGDDAYDSKYYVNYNIANMYYLGKLFIKFNERNNYISEISEQIPGFNKQLYGNYNNGYYSRTNNTKIPYENTKNAINALLPEGDFSGLIYQLGESNNDNLNNNFELYKNGLSSIYDEIYGIQPTTPNSYLIFTHRESGYRFIANIIDGRIIVYAMYNPDGTKITPKDTASKWFSANDLYLNRYFNLDTSNNNIVNATIRLWSYENLDTNFNITDDTLISPVVIAFNDTNSYIFNKELKDGPFPYNINDGYNYNKGVLYGHRVSEGVNTYEKYNPEYEDNYNDDSPKLYYWWKLFRLISKPDIYKIGEYVKDTADSEDPYEEGGNSVIGGGDGKFDDTNDKIDSDFDLSGISSMISNLVAIWLPTPDNMQTISSTLNSTDFLGGITNYFSGFDKYLISINVIPTAIPATGNRTMMFRSQIVCGNVPFTKNTLITKSMGSIKVEPYYGNALDYQATYELYLPFIGNHRLQAEDVVGKELSIVYRIDVVTGACLARVYSNGTCRYEFSGNCAYTIPINVESYNSTIQALIQATASIGAGIASGGNAVIGSLGASQAANLAMNIANKDMQYRGGGGTGNAAFLGTNFPYLTITRINMSNPSGYNKFYGYPSNITETLGNLSGFTKVDAVHLEGIKATQNELKEIEQLLKEGVIC